MQTINAKINANNKMSAFVKTYARVSWIWQGAGSCIITVVEVLGVILFEKVSGYSCIKLFNHSKINNVRLASDGTVGSIIVLHCIIEAGFNQLFRKLNSINSKYIMVNQYLGCVVTFNQWYPWTAGILDIYINVTLMFNYREKLLCG